MKCLFIYMDGREELHDQPVYGLSEAGQPLPPVAWDLHSAPPMVGCFKADAETDLMTAGPRIHRFRVRTRTAYELLPVYKEIAS